MFRKSGTVNTFVRSTKSCTTDHCKLLQKTRAQFSKKSVQQWDQHYSLFTSCAIVSTGYLSQSNRIMFTFINNSVFRTAFSPFCMKGSHLSGQERDMKLIQHQISYKYYVKIRYWGEKNIFWKGCWALEESFLENSGIIPGSIQKECGYDI